MKRADIYTLLLLISLTIITAIISVNYNSLRSVSVAILGLSSVKFLAVSFQFMELKKAHIFWRILISTFLILNLSIIYFLL